MSEENSPVQNFQHGDETGDMAVVNASRNGEQNVYSNTNMFIQSLATEKQKMLRWPTILSLMMITGPKRMTFEQFNSFRCSVNWILKTRMNFENNEGRSTTNGLMKQYFQGKLLLFQLTQKFIAHFSRVY